MLKNIKSNSFLYNIELSNIIATDSLIKKYYKFKINNSCNYYLFTLNINRQNIFLDHFNNKAILFKINFYTNILNKKNLSIKESEILKRKIKKYKSILYYYKSISLVRKIKSYNLLYNINNFNIFSKKKIKAINLYKSFKRKLRRRQLRFFTKYNKLFYNTRYFNLITYIFTHINIICYSDSVKERKFIYVRIKQFLYKILKLIFIYKSKYGIKQKKLFNSIRFFLRRIKYRRKFYLKKRKKKRFYRLRLRRKLRHLARLRSLKYFKNFRLKRYSYKKKIKKVFLKKYCKKLSDLLTYILLFSKKPKKRILLTFSMLYYDFLFFNKIKTKNSIFKVNKFLTRMIYNQRFKRWKKNYNYRFRKFKRKINRNKYFRHLLKKKLNNKLKYANKFKKIRNNIIYYFFRKNYKKKKDSLIRYKLSSVIKGITNNDRDKKKLNKLFLSLKFNNIMYLNKGFYFKRRMNYLISFLTTLYKFINKNNSYKFYVFFKKIKQLYFYSKYMFENNVNKYFLKNKKLLNNNIKEEFNPFINKILIKNLSFLKNKLYLKPDDIINNFLIGSLNIEFENLSIVDKNTIFRGILNNYRDFSLFIKKSIIDKHIYNKYYSLTYKNIYKIKSIDFDIFRKKDKLYSKRNFFNTRKINLLKKNRFRNIYFLDNKLVNMELRHIKFINKPLYIISHITKKNYRYHILNSKLKILRSSSFGSLGIERKERRLKKSKLKMGEAFLKHMKYLFFLNKKKKKTLFNELHFHFLRYKFPVRYVFKEFRKYMRRKKYKYYKKKIKSYVKRVKKTFFDKFFLKYKFRSKFYKRGFSLRGHSEKRRKKKFRSFY